MPGFVFQWLEIWQESYLCTKVRVETNTESYHGTWGQDGEKAQLSLRLHSISLKLSPKRYAVICEDMIQVRRFKAEEKLQLFNRIPRALRVIQGELRSDESFSSFHSSLFSWLFWCLLCTEVRMTDGALGTTVQVDKRLSILNTITLLQVGRRESWIVKRYLTLRPVCRKASYFSP